MHRLRQLFETHYTPVAWRLLVHALVLAMCTLLVSLPTLRIDAQASGTAQLNSADLTMLIIVLIVVVLALPAGYLLFNKPRQTPRSLLLVTTDTDAQRLITNAARRVGYQAITVYRYEDALEKLRQNSTLSMIVIDNSVPQYEAGMLVSMLQGSPIGLRPLILIHDSSELGQTAPSYRAEVVVSRPLTEKLLEDAIRQVSDQLW